MAAHAAALVAAEDRIAAAAEIVLTAARGAAAVGDN